MSTNAPGQLLGFGLQFPRALFHLLRCGPGDKVSLEVMGDVSTVSVDDDVIIEEDKSSQISNPISDLSIESWKTFYNWVNKANTKTIDPDMTKLLL